MEQSERKQGQIQNKKKKKTNKKKTPHLQPY
jgi:hypothetical protein